SLPPFAFRVHAQAPPASPAQSNLTSTLRPFIARNCETCHNTSLPSGSIDLQELLRPIRYPNGATHGRTSPTFYDPAGCRRKSRLSPLQERDAVVKLISRALNAGAALKMACVVQVEAVKASAMIPSARARGESTVTQVQMSAVYRFYGFGRGGAI